MGRKPLNNPDVQIAIRERALMIKAGVDVKDAQKVAAYKSSIEEANKTRRAQELKGILDQEREVNERIETLATRLKKREDRPVDYIAPKDFRELQARVDAGESYFEYMDIDHNEFVDIDASLDLSGCNLRNSKLKNVRLIGANQFMGTDFGHSELVRVNFGSNTDCTDANFDSSKLLSTTFNVECIIERASFNYATFDSKTRFEFDQNVALHAIFNMPKNKWQTLVHSYTGAQQFINLSLGLGYFGLLLIKIFVLEALANFQVMLRDVNPNSAGSVFDYEQPQQVWTLAFGGFSPTYLSLFVAFFILIYQAGRVFITSRIAPLIESQKVDGRTPPRASYEALIDLNAYIRWLGFIAVSLFLMNIATALFANVFPLL